MKRIDRIRKMKEEAGRIGGLVSTPDKVKAARKNGSKGGRPKVKNPSYMTLAKRRSRKRQEDAD